MNRFSKGALALGVLLAGIVGATPATAGDLTDAGRSATIAHLTSAYHWDTVVYAAEAYQAPGNGGTATVSASCNVWVEHLTTVINQTQAVCTIETPRTRRVYPLTQVSSFGSVGVSAGTWVLSAQEEHQLCMHAVLDGYRAEKVCSPLQDL